MIRILVAVLLLLPWYDYRWEVTPGLPRVRLCDLPVIVRDCWHAPGVEATNGCQVRFDYNDDGCVDLADYAILQRRGR